MSDYLMHFNRNHDKNGRFARGDGDGKPNVLPDIRRRSGEVVRNQTKTKWWTTDSASNARRSASNTANKARSEVERKYTQNRNFRKAYGAASNAASRAVSKVKNTFTDANFSSGKSKTVSSTYRRGKDFVDKTVNDLANAKNNTGAKSYDKAYKNSDNVSKAVSAGKNYVSRVISSIEEAKKKKKKKKKQFTREVTPKFATVSTTSNSSNKKKVVNIETYKNGNMEYKDVPLTRKQYNAINGAYAVARKVTSITRKKRS